MLECCGSTSPTQLSSPKLRNGARLFMATRPGGQARLSGSHADSHPTVRNTLLTPALNTLRKCDCAVADRSQVTLALSGVWPFKSL